MISKILQILGLQPRISKVFSITRFFFLTVGQYNFGNKIPFLSTSKNFFLNIFSSVSLYSVQTWEPGQFKHGVGNKPTLPDHIGSKENDYGESLFKGSHPLPTHDLNDFGYIEDIGDFEESKEPEESEEPEKTEEPKEPEISEATEEHEELTVGF